MNLLSPDVNPDMQVHLYFQGINLQNLSFLGYVLLSHLQQHFNFTTDCVYIQLMHLSMYFLIWLSFHSGGLLISQLTVYIQLILHSGGLSIL